MTDVTVKLILDWETLKSRKDAQGFLGFASFYCRLIEGYSRVCTPRTGTMKTKDPTATATTNDRIDDTGGATMKSTSINWTKKWDDVVRELKPRFTTSPIPSHFMFQLPRGEHTNKLHHQRSPSRYLATIASATRSVGGRRQVPMRSKEDSAWWSSHTPVSSSWIHRRAPGLPEGRATDLSTTTAV